MKKVFFIVLIIIMLFVEISCTVPQYEFLAEDQNDNRVVEINNITYVDLPSIFWRPTNIKNRTLIGELIYPKAVEHIFLTKIYTFDDDINKMFIALKSKPAKWLSVNNTVGPEEVYYFRSDTAFPSMDSSGVDAIGIREEGKSEFFNIVQDKETIGQLLDEMSRAEAQEAAGDQCVYVLELTNSDFPGIEIQVNVCRQGDEYWLYFNELNHFVYDNSHDDLYYYSYYAVQISRELLEKIAGEALPI